MQLQLDEQILAQDLLRDVLETSQNFAPAFPYIALLCVAEKPNDKPCQQKGAARQVIDRIDFLSNAQKTELMTKFSKASFAGCFPSLVERGHRLVKEASLAPA